MANSRKAAESFTRGGNSLSLQQASRSESIDGQSLHSESRSFVSAPDIDFPQSLPNGHEKEALMKIFHQFIHLRTGEHLQFVDLTDMVSECIRNNHVRNGFVNVQTQHTTAAIIVNEHEPLLLEDMKKLLERMAPQDREYQHDNFAIRTANLCPEERTNGHSHCQAMLLGASETLNILNGRIQLGQWQRIFFIELDGARERRVSVMIVGA